MSFNSCRSRESVACVTRNRCCASRRRKSSWLPMRSLKTSEDLPVPYGFRSAHVKLQPSVYLYSRMRGAVKLFDKFG